MSHNIFRVFRNVEVEPGGTVITNIIGGPPFTLTGTVEQIIISWAGGDITEADVQVRYNDTSGSRISLVYLYEEAAITNGTPFIDSAIAAPFSLKVRVSNIADGDLSFFIDPDAAGTVNIRIDFVIDRWY